MNESLELTNGLKVQLIQDSKFDEVLVNMKLFFELKEPQNTVANLLSKMMGDRTEFEPTKQSIQRRMDLMYGTRTGVQTYAQGKYQVIDVSVKSIHSHFVEEDLMQDQLGLLLDMIKHPLLNDASLKEAKEGLKLQHARIKESTSRYAQMRAFELSAPNQVFSLNTLGAVEEVEKVTLEDIKKFHAEILENASKLMYIVGDVSMPDLSAFEGLIHQPFTDPLLKTHVTVRKVEEFHEGGQTDLMLIYESDIDPNHPLYAAYLVYVAHLGQLPSSLLFQNIREKHSLAYSIYASRQVFDGVMFIATGINDQHRDKTLELIEAQLETMKSGDYDIKPAIQYLVMGLEGNTESLKSQADFRFRNDLLGSEESIRTLQEKLRKVRVEDVIAVSEHIKDPFIYAYRGENHETN